MLWFAAWITLRHPSLKFAVWHEEGTILENTVIALSRWGGTLQVQLSSKKPSNLCYYPDPQETIDQNEDLRDRKETLQEYLDANDQIEERNADVLEEWQCYQLVTLLDEVAHYNVLDDLNFRSPDPYWDNDGDLRILSAPLLEPLNTLLDQEQIILDTPLGLLTPPSGILLDSFRIRHTGFAGLADPDYYRPYHYQLPPNARDSEAEVPPALLNVTNEVLRDELFAFNSQRWQILEQIINAGSLLRSLCTQAATAEHLNIAREFFAKDGTRSELLEDPAPLDAEAMVISANTENNDEAQEEDWLEGDVVQPDFQVETGEDGQGDYAGIVQHDVHEDTQKRPLREIHISELNEEVQAAILFWQGPTVPQLTLSIPAPVSHAQSSLQDRLEALGFFSEQDPAHDNGEDNASSSIIVDSAGSADHEEIPPPIEMDENWLWSDED